MNNLLTILMVVFTLVPIAIGLLLGLLRGWRRATLRLGLVLLSLILAFALRNVVTNRLFNAEFTIEGETFSFVTLISGILGEDMAAMGLTDVIIPLAKTLSNIISFLILFDVFLFITWAIVFPICQIFVKPKVIKDVSVGEDGQKVKVVKKYGRLGGMGIGALQGFIVAAVVCVLLTGVLVQTNKVMVAAQDLMPSESVETLPDEDLGHDDMFGGDFADIDVNAIFDNYLQSGTGKFYNTKAAQGIVSLVSSTKIDGEKKTLPGQIDAITTLLKMIGKLEDIQDVDFDAILSGEDPNGSQTIRDIFYGLDDLIHGEGVTDETKETINNVVGSLAGNLGNQFDLPIDLSGMDFTDIDFKSEGDLIADLIDYTKSETVTEEDVQNILEKVVKSELVLPILDNSGVDIGERLNEDQRDTVEEIIDGLQNIDADKLAMIRRIFGLD